MSKQPRLLLLLVRLDATRIDADKHDYLTVRLFPLYSVPLWKFTSVHVHYAMEVILYSTTGLALPPTTLELKQLQMPCPNPDKSAVTVEQKIKSHIKLKKIMSLVPRTLYGSDRRVSTAV